MTPPPILHALARIRDLRHAELPMRVSTDTPLVPDVYFSWDTANGSVDITLSRHEDGLFTAVLKVSGRPRWLTFNIGLGGGAFEVGDLLGLVIETGPDNGAAGEAIGLLPFLRSAEGGERQDTPMFGALHLGAGRGLWALVHRIGIGEPLGRLKAYHTLVLPLPATDLTLDLRDLRLFCAPMIAGAGPILR